MPVTAPAVAAAVDSTSACSAALSGVLSDSTPNCGVTVSTVISTECAVSPVHLLIVEPALANRADWMISVANRALDDLEARPERAPLAGVVQFDSDRASVVQSLTSDYSRLRRAVARAEQGGGISNGDYEAAAERAVDVLAAAASAPRPSDFVLWFSSLKEVGFPDGRRGLGAASNAIDDAGAHLIVGCPQVPFESYCLSTRAMVSDLADFGTPPDLQKLPDRLAAQIDALPDGINDVTEMVVTHTLPAGLEYLDGSANTPPTHVRRGPGLSELVWRWDALEASRPHTITYTTQPLRGGRYSITATVAITDVTRTRFIAADTFDSVDVGFGCAPTLTATADPTETPTPSTPTPTTQPPRLFLPVALTERCLPTSQHADIVLVIDASTSMADEIRPGRSKLAAAAAAIAAFVPLLSRADQTAVVSFNDTAYLDQPLTTDRPSVLVALAQLQLRQFTRIDAGIELAADELSGPRHIASHRAVAIILTDGKANPAGPERAVAAAQRAKDAHITIFTIGLGAPDQLDDEALTAMASAPNFSYRSPDADQLDAIYTEIARAIPCPPDSFWPSSANARPTNGRHSHGSQDTTSRQLRLWSSGRR
jgi:Mg-chelatase subunit ChlD